MTNSFDKQWLRRATWTPSATVSFAAVSFAAVLVLGAPAARADPPVAPTLGEIRFSVQVDATKGHVICALFRKEGWLKTPIQSKNSLIRTGSAECVFTGIAPDVYAVSAFHDENDNGKLDTGLFGIPTESWCTSRNAKGMFGPPSFDDAKFRHTGGVIRQTASLK